MRLGSFHQWITTRYLTVIERITGSISGSAATVRDAAQPAITSVGTLSGLGVTAQITGSVSGSAATVRDAAQPAITSVGTLSSLVVDGGITLPKTSGVGVKVDVAAPTFAWRDIIGRVQPKATGAGSPARAVYIGGQLGQYAFAANDLYDMEFHIPHDYVPGTDIYFHIHWSHNGTTTSGNAVFDIFHTYSKGHNQDIFVAEKNITITYDTVNIATTPQYRHRIDEVIISGPSATATLMDRDNIEVDGLLLATLRVTTLPTLGGGGKLFVNTCDVHYQSTSVGTKQKAPPFWT